MKKHLTNFIIAVGVVLLMFTLRTSAAEYVEVSIVSTPVQVAYMHVYSPQAEYPVIMYNDICYIPMTYNLCEMMNLAVGYSTNDGLYITHHEKAEVRQSSPFGRIDFTNDTAVRHKAVIPEYPIYLNGVLIDNTDQQYPVLNFRDITYFPLTYRYATEEFDIHVYQSEEYFIIANPGYRIYNGEGADSPAVNFLNENNDGSIGIMTQTYAYNTYIDPSDGFTKSFSYFWWDEYRLTPSKESDTLIKIATYKDLKELPKNPHIPDAPYSDRITIKNSRIYYGETELSNYEYDDSFLGANGKEYTFGDTTFIVVSASFGDKSIPVLRYPGRKEFLYVKDSSGIRPLSLWDNQNMFSGIIPDGCGGFYVYSDYYYTTGTSRWGRNIGTAYRYTVDGDFYEIKIPDTNSIEVIGVYDKKLYVRAVYHENDKYVMTSGAISAVNSGFFEIDTVSGKCTKIRPYFPGKTYFTQKGEIYAIKEFGFRPKVMNIKTGQELIIG